MSRKEQLAAVKAAQIHLRLQQLRFRAASRPWLRRFQEHRASIVLGGSFVGGLLMARTPGRLLARAASLGVGLTSLMLRTPLGSLMIAGIATRRASRDDTHESSAAD